MSIFSNSQETVYYMMTIVYVFLFGRTKHTQRHINTKTQTPQTLIMYNLLHEHGIDILN